MKEVSKNLLNEVSLTPIKERRAKVEAFVKQQRPKSKAEDTIKATNSLLSLLAFYPPEVFDEKNGKPDANIVALASNQIADAYAASRRNSAILDNDGKWYFGGGQLGVQFVSGYYPIPTLALNFKQHNVEASRATTESRQEANNRIFGGEGNFSLDNWNTRQEWNQAMLDDIVNDNLTLNGKAKVVIENGYIKIPKAVWENQKANVVIDAAMQ